MRPQNETYDVVVCGGGLAGLCAAISSARRGAKTCLVHDRPVLGGNSSSEIRVALRGAASHHAYARETGVISDILANERLHNHAAADRDGWTNSAWDLALYDAAIVTPNLFLKLNAIASDVVLDDGTKAVKELPSVIPGYAHRPACSRCRQLRAVIVNTPSADTQTTLEASIFVDCTGDGVLADMAGCEWRMGSEGRAEFGEPHAAEEPSRDTMGSSILFTTRNLGRPAPFVPPSWIAEYADDRYFRQTGREFSDLGGGYSWIEIGVPWNTIYNAEDIRHELTRHALGVWDWIKNKDPRTRTAAANFALEWIGQVPGKRESRRIIGRYFMTEHDLLRGTVFPDEAAYGAWPLDLRNTGGLLAEKPVPDLPAESFALAEVTPYGIPLRCLIARDLDNLLMAGRNISVTHACLGSMRVMGTAAVLGQAAGTAAALALERSRPVHRIPDELAEEFRDALLRDGCFLPHFANADPADHAPEAVVTASSEAIVSDTGAAPDCDPTFGALDKRRSQWIAVAGERVQRIGFCLSNLSPDRRVIYAELYPVESIWESRPEPCRPLKIAEIDLPSGSAIWAEWPCAVDVDPGTYLRLDLFGAPDVIWHRSAATLFAHPAASEGPHGRLRRGPAGFTRAFRVDPPQACFAPINVVTGVTRPHRWTNLWIADPAAAIPAHIDLHWEESIALLKVELTFAGHLDTPFEMLPPGHRDPETVSDYRLLADVDGAWKEIAAVRGNHHRRRVHDLGTSIETSRLRIELLATCGGTPPSLYEIRAYS